MADYYIDGTISSASGTGSGTLVDPWGKDDDLLAYAIAQVGGSGTHGHEYIVVNGNLNATAALVLSGYSYTKPITVRPLVMDGTQRIAYDGGAVKFQNATNISGINTYFVDFSNMVTTGTFFDCNGRSNIVGCSFDGTGKLSGNYLDVGASSVVMGSHFYNDERTGSGLFIYLNSGSMALGNFFDNITRHAYDLYTRGSEFRNNVLTYDSGYTYNTGSILPIDSGKIDNNTFIGPGAGGGTAAAACIYVPNSYEVNHIANNYFEGFSLCINVSTSSTHPYLINQLVGNRYHNCTNFVEGGAPSDSIILNEENEELSSTGLVDISSADYRPNNLLINQGYDPFAMVNAITNTVRPTVGAIENRIAAPRVRDLY